MKMILKQEYMIDECIYCGKKRIIRRKTVPKGREEYKTQIYLHCTYCRKNMMIRKEGLNNGNGKEMVERGKMAK